jgi:hypothetical protein
MINSTNAASCLLKWPLTPKITPIIIAKTKDKYTRKAVLAIFNQVDGFCSNITKALSISEGEGTKKEEGRTSQIKTAPKKAINARERFFHLVFFCFFRRFNR